MPGSGQWTLVCDREPYRSIRNGPDAQRTLNDQLLKPECWCCSGHTYTLIFWSKHIWEQVYAKTARLQEEFVEHYAENLLPAEEACWANFTPSRYDSFDRIPNLAQQRSSEERRSPLESQPKKGDK